MKKIMMEKGLENNSYFKEEIDGFFKLLERYNHNINDYYITTMLVQSDNMNSPIHIVEDKLVCIPKEFKDVAVKIMCNFTCDNIELLDKDKNVLCSTAWTGYDDIVTPTFFVESETMKYYY